MMHGQTKIKSRRDKCLICNTIN